MDGKAGICIVGGGKVGVSWIKRLSKEPDLRVASVVTKSEPRRQELSSTYDILAFSTLREALNSAKPDVVCVVNANEDHAPAAVEALEANCHVYLEKPMAPTLEECVRIIEAEKKSSGRLQVGFEYIHGTMTGRIRELLREGYFGEPLWASVLDSRGHWWADSPHAPSESIWKLDRKRGGGIIFHCGIHQLDIIRNYLGSIEEITAFRPPQNPLSFYPEDVPANVTLMLKATSGAVCNFQIFHDRAVTYYREEGYSPNYWSSPGHEFNISLVGTEASCYMRIYDEVLHLFKLDSETKENKLDRSELFGPNPPDKTHHDMIGLVLRFIRSATAGGPAIDSADSALETMRMAFAAEDAIALGSTVYLSDYR